LLEVEKKAEAKVKASGEADGKEFKVAEGLMAGKKGTTSKKTNIRNKTVRRGKLTHSESEIVLVLQALGIQHVSQPM